jgi:hypothetical protein
MVEVSAGVISCNIPATAPLFLAWLRKIRGDQSTKGSSPYKGYALSNSHHKRYNKVLNYRSGRSPKNSGQTTSEGFSTLDSTYDPRIFDGNLEEEGMELKVSTARPEQRRGPSTETGPTLAPLDRIHVKNEVQQTIQTRGGRS